MIDETDHFDIVHITIDELHSPPPLKRSFVVLDGDRMAICGPRDIVPAQAWPGRSCLRSACPNNVEHVCVEEDRYVGGLAPFRPLCPDDRSE